MKAFAYDKFHVNEILMFFLENEENFLIKLSGHKHFSLFSCNDFKSLIYRVVKTQNSVRILTLFKMRNKVLKCVTVSCEREKEKKY